MNINKRKMGLLNGKVALITGAARGIGKAIALKYASEGADIAFTDLVINEAAEATVKEIEAFGVKARAYASNAADFEQTHNVVAEILAEFGHIDILVNNAGITKDGLMMRMTEQQWDAVLTVNLKSAFNFIHACTPIMAKQRGGSIINMSSVVRKCRTVQLLCLKGRPHRTCKVHRKGNGTKGHPRKLHRSGLHHHGHDQRASRESTSGVGDKNPSPPWRYS